MSSQDPPLLPVGDLALDPAQRFDTQRGALVGSRCRSCRTVVFPRGLACHNCRGLDLEPHHLPTEGKVVAFTTVRVSSRSPVPYTVGFVDLPGPVRVMARIRPVPDDLQCDDAVHLVSDAEGWAFTEERKDSDD